MNRGHLYIDRGDGPVELGAVRQMDLGCVDAVHATLPETVTGQFEGSLTLGEFDWDALAHLSPPDPPLVTLHFTRSWRSRFFSWPWRPWVTGAVVTARGGAFASTRDGFSYELDAPPESVQDTYARWWPRRWRA